MSEHTHQPPILLHLDGFEDFHSVVALLRATGARRWSQGRSSRQGSGNSRTFAIDGTLTAHQAASLIELIEYGTAEGFLKVTVTAPEYDEAGAEEWWETA
jgi:hypothetical protein